MNPLLLAAADKAAGLTARDVFACPTFWALVCGVLGLWFVLPARFRFGNAIGSVLLAIAGGLFAFDLPLLGPRLDQGVFWLLAGVTLAASVCTISSRSPVYCAIWFALSLLGTAGLYLFQGAQFLGVATIVVYAGAIVVTFLFVIMLAQPEGHTMYDRISWGWFPKVFGVVAAGTLVGILTFMLGGLKDASTRPVSADAVAAADQRLQADAGILSDHHMANLGRHLFAEHLVSVEVAGTLLLAALVGAIAIAAYGKQASGGRQPPEGFAARIEEALR
ncbi:MAG TPA: NADH-quinone oxidoreductase subunit J [Pirellulaceae bacterium]|nr:NADH-quinone oxidoreductase subunit J [Pirellulaceae bacterium]